MPPGDEVTIPIPLPNLLTLIGKDWIPKLALTERRLFIVTVQVVPEVLSQPFQMEKVAPVEGVAVSVTVVLIVMEAEQLLPPAPQLIPPTSLLTVPLPAVATERVKLFRVKVAVMFLVPLMLTVHIAPVVLS